MVARALAQFGRVRLHRFLRRFHDPSLSNLEASGEAGAVQINAVLRTYMLALISKEVLSLGDRNRHGDEVWGKAAKGVTGAATGD